MWNIIAIVTLLIGSYRNDAIFALSANWFLRGYLMNIALPQLCLLYTSTNTPILLTVNARGMGRSLLALLSGFLQYDTAHLIKGVILNQTPSSFASVLAKEIEETFHIPVVASFPVRDDVRIESRHLGLVMPYELCLLYTSRR